MWKSLNYNYKEIDKFIKVIKHLLLKVNCKKKNRF